MAAPNDIDKRVLLRSVEELKKEVKILEQSQQALLAEINTVKKDQFDHYVYARKQLNFTLRLCTQVERIIDQEGIDSRSLELLQAIGRDILKTLERYHAPGTSDPLRFQKQRNMKMLVCIEEQMNHSGCLPPTKPFPTAENATGEQCKSVQELSGAMFQGFGGGDIFAHESSVKPISKESRNGVIPQVPSISRQEPCDSLLDTSIFNPPSSNRSEYIPKATARVLSAIASGGESSSWVSAPVSGKSNRASIQ